MNKERYSNVELEIVKLDSSDVITTSGGIPGSNVGGDSTKYVDLIGWD